MDRKRRLTSTANDDATPPRRPSALSRSSPSSTRTISQQDRPLPMLPASDSRSTDLSSDVPGSSRENAIDLTSSPSSGDSLPGHSDRDLPSIPQGHRQSLMELALPRWQPDSEVTHCPICKSQFSFWYRKHHCRKCGRVVCSSCSPHRITIPRQYIVRPPETPAQSNIEISSPNRLEFSSSSTDSTASDTYNTTSGLLPSRFPGSVSVNPALGGGEEVRLCNPCVPDPNPDPPRDYHVVRADLNREPGRDWDSSMPSLPIGQRIHQARHSLSSAQAFRIRRDQNAAGHNPHNREQALNDFLGRRIPSSFSASLDPRSQHSTSHDVSSLCLNHPANQPSTSAQSYSFSSNRPRAETHTGSVLPEFPGNRSRRVQSTAEADRSRFPRPSQPEFVIDEADLCPVCGRLFPPRQGNTNDEEREAHIRGCIARISGSSPGLSSSQSQHHLRMLSFIATEKDCLSEDGTPQECTICMEEYEVGDKLARLECLCKFHKSCIVEWFERKKECPVHKFS